TKVEIDLLAGMGKVERTLDLLGTKDYILMRKEAFANDGVNEYTTNAFDINGTWDQKRETDWQNELFGKTSYLTNLRGEVSGGDSNTQFLISGNLHKQTTVFPGDYKNDKVSLLTNLGHQSRND